MREGNRFLLQMGIPEKNTSTRNYQVIPIYNTAFNNHNKTWNQVLISYRIIKEVEIILSNLKNMPEFIDRLVAFEMFILLIYSFFMVNN
jgi:uncharacterized protein YggE